MDIESLPPEVADQLLRNLAQRDGVECGSPWDARLIYPMGWTATHAGRSWISERRVNRTEPGAGDQWRTCGEGETPELWDREEVYDALDRVAYDDDEIWMSVIDRNRHAPKVHGWEREI